MISGKHVGALVLVGVVGGTGLALGSAKPKDPELNTSKNRYRTKETVVVRVANDTDSAVGLEGPWRIRRVSSGAVVARRRWDAKQMQSGATRVWRWDQRRTGCGGSGASCPRVGPGGYQVVVRTDDGTLREPFDIGRYFTVGFDGSEATFVVFARERKPIRQMDEEAEAEEKTLIVSGIVRDGALYNPDWSYTMGPGSIVLGEVFIETCDASPEYVEENRDEWMGDRWCPWSSYVAKKGKP